MSLMTDESNCVCFPVVLSSVLSVIQEFSHISYPHDNKKLYDIMIICQLDQKREL